MLAISNKDLFDSIIKLTRLGNTLEHSCEIINISRGYVYQKLSKEQLTEIKLSKVKKTRKKYIFTKTNEFNGFY